MNRMLAKIAVVIVTTMAALSTGLVATSAQAVEGREPNTRVAVRPAVAALLDSAGITARPINGASAYGFRGRWPSTSRSPAPHRVVTG